MSNANTIILIVAAVIVGGIIMFRDRISFFMDAQDHKQRVKEEEELKRLMETNEKLKQHYEVRKELKKQRDLNKELRKNPLREQTRTGFGNSNSLFDDKNSLFKGK